MWGRKRLFWQPGKWSLLRMVFFPSTDPPLNFITSSGSFGIDILFRFRFQLLSRATLNSWLLLFSLRFNFFFSTASHDSLPITFHFFCLLPLLKCDFFFNFPLYDSYLWSNNCTCFNSIYNSLMIIITKEEKQITIISVV